MLFNCAILFLWAILLLQDFSHCLRLVEVRIPNYVVKGSAAQLECLYDLDGESLYSVKWYKDGNEFYRYVPRDMPPAQTFLLPGVSVDVHNSSDAVVTLREVNLQSAGRFRCEVSGEAPSFQTVTEHGDMVVVSLPDQGAPKITGGRPRYQIGDTVRINCTAGRSKPAVQLAWFINGEPAEPYQLRKYDPVLWGRDGLETSILGLQFRVDQHHFRNGDMKLKCVASLSTFYWRSNEESVEGDRPQKAPVLESRETVYASNSRADPVQATNKTDSTMTTIKPSTLILLIAMALLTSSGCFEQLHFNGGRGGGGGTKKHSHKTSQSGEENSEKEITNKSSYDIDADDDDNKDEEDTVNNDGKEYRHHDCNVKDAGDIGSKSCGHNLASKVLQRQVVRALSKEMHFNKEMSCLPIMLTNTTVPNAITTTTSTTTTTNATISGTISVYHQHAFNVTTSVSLEQIFKSCNSYNAKTSRPSLLTLPSSLLSSSLSSCSSLPLSSPSCLSSSSCYLLGGESAFTAQQDQQQQGQCLVASR
ncbi:uncharacterized protein LOC105261657 isoform X2 [Musca domestica]|uniref:Uncharacterized protein LOC105261657 isoform X2 n=1 Tax=Musca domestica TaxID=7370 RepID=A0ABM3V283_MUSDO|nr:uncharacterized protein LOC105261657 isoform X2 [Musca domestica]